LSKAIPRLPSDAPPGAIIVLGSDTRRGQQYTVGPLTLERLAERQDKSGVSDCRAGQWRGGQTEKSDDSLAEMMSDALAKDSVSYTIARTVRGIPSRMRFLGGDLRRAGVAVGTSLVTQSWDMARSPWSFRAVGYPVIPGRSRQQTAANGETTAGPARSR